VSLQGSEIPWFHDPDAPRYPGIDWSHPTPFILKMLADADHAADKEKFEKKEGEEEAPLLFAPDAVYRDGRYYLYFCMKDDSEGVAVSDRPQGPFHDPIQLPCGGIDPAVFIDDDGQAYLYWGQLFSHGVKLNQDMVSFDRENIVDDLVTEEEHFFHEGSSMRKIGGLYYYIYANMERGKPTSLGYATGKSPLGPFQYRGIIIDNDGCDPASWNNHGSIECFQGQWYVFYHRCSRGVQQHRRLCIERIQINEDGTIPEVKMTSQGIGAPFAPGERIRGYQACGLKGSCFIDVDDTYGEKITNISAGDEAVFRYVKSADSWKEIAVTCNGSGSIEVYLDNVCAGKIEAENGHCEYGPFHAAAGEYELILKFKAAEELEILDITLQ
ncbi:MAG: family 43 glycosylhydrolase, partial [Ruminococcus flavefaciens]|nr:family 43 glycosylhydrolase [Ruminococcus flavefaciens]